MDPELELLQGIAQLAGPYASAVGALLGVAYFAVRWYIRLRRLEREVREHRKDLAWIKDSLPPSARTPSDEPP